MRVALRLPALIGGLTVLWVALWDELTLGNVVSGVAVSTVVALVAARHPSELRGGAHLHPWHALAYVGLLGWDLILSNLRLAWEILTPGDGTHTGIIAAPMRTDSDVVVMLVANSITLTPGTLTVDVKREGGEVTLYVHGMFTSDVEAVRRGVAQLEARALRAFGSREAAAHAGRERYDEMRDRPQEGDR